MNIKIILLFFFNIITLWVWAQDDSNMSYYRMEGTIGDKIEVTANFIRLFNKIEGNYQYKFKEKNSTMFYGRMIELEGRILKNDSLYLKEYGSNTPSFSGVWKDHSFVGKWRVPDEENSFLNVSLKEYYPMGSIPFDVFYLTSERKLVSKAKESPTATLELTMISPKNNHLQPGVLDSIKQILNRGFFGNNFASTSPQTMMTNYKNEYYKNYKAANLDMYQEMKEGASFSWASVNSMSVLYNANYLLCVEYQKYAYTGGAHGMTNISYDIIDLETGKALDYNDIFIDNADSILTSILTGKMLTKYKTKKESSLKQVGFFTNEITPNRNVYVTGNGIGFKYASYEVAPYSYGLPEVFLNFSEIKEIIRPGTPVYRLSRQKQQ